MFLTLLGCPSVSSKIHWIFHGFSQWNIGLLWTFDVFRCFLPLFLKQHPAFPSIKCEMKHDETQSQSPKEVILRAWPHMSFFESYKKTPRSHETLGYGPIFGQTHVLCLKTGAKHAARQGQVQLSIVGSWKNMWIRRASRKEAPSSKLPKSKCKR